MGGKLNSDEKYEKKNLLIDSLVQRVKKNNLKEVIKKIGSENIAGLLMEPINHSSGIYYILYEEEKQ